MPAIFINPNKDEHYDFLFKLNEQNQDLRLFISDKLQKEEIESFPGKKAIGDIYDDTHISTASEGTFCAIYFEGEDQTLRETFISSKTLGEARGLKGLFVISWFIFYTSI